MRKKAIAATAGPMNTHGLRRSSHFPGSISTSLFRIQNSSRAAPTPPTIASKALISLIIDLLLSAHAPRAALGMGGRATRSRAPTRQRLAWPALLDVLQRLVQALLPADPGGHALPEAAGANRTRHLVGTVEPEHRRPVGDRGDRLGGPVRVLAHVEGLVRRDPARRGQVGELELGAGEVRHDLLGVLVVAEGASEVTTAEERLAVGVHPREVEHADLFVQVLADLLGEEALLGDEVALPVQEALGRVLEHGVGRGREVVARDRLAAAEDVLVDER